MNKSFDIHRKHSDGARYLEEIDTPDYSIGGYGYLAGARALNAQIQRTCFNLLPAGTVAAGTDKFFTVTGTGTEVIARSTAAKGNGVNLKTQATTPLTADNVFLAAVATTRFAQELNAACGLHFKTVISLSDVAEIMASFGVNENVTDVDPTGTAGEGAMFLADPTQGVTTGLTAAQHLNWILAYKVNGADTFAATTIPLVADQPVDLEIKLNADLTASMYINGTLVGASPALTSGDTVKAFLGLEEAADAQHNFDVRFVEMGPAVVL